MSAHTLILNCWVGLALSLGLACPLLAQAPVGAPPVPAAAVSTVAPVGTPATTASSANKPAAVIDGEVVSHAEVEAVVTKLIGAGPHPVPIPEAKKKEQRLLALGMLIDDLLWRQALSKGPQVDQTKIDARMKELVESLAKKSMSLDDFCKETGQTLAQLRAKMIALVQWGDYIKDKVSEEQLKAYYVEYKDFFEGTSVRASHIVIRVGSEASATEVQAVQAKLASLKADVEANKITFAAAAEQHSQCPSSKKEGDIGYIPRKWGLVDEAFAKAAFAPRPLSQLSEPIRTEFGWHLIKVTDRKPGKTSTYDEVKEEVREHLLEDIRQNLIGQQRKLLADKIKIMLD